MNTYKKKYKEALERARKLAADLPNGRNDRLYHVGDLESIFPELKESEDKRIKNEIINFIKDNTLTYTNRGSEIQMRWIAWLEKQGEQKPTDEEMKTILRTEYEKGRADAMAEVQKSWSEEDDDNMLMIEDRLSDYLDYIREDSSLTKHRKNSLKEEVIGYVKWLKSLKGRVQPQNTWKPSEDKFAHIVGCLVQDVVANEHMPEEEKQPTKFFVEKYYKKLREEDV